MQEYLLILKKQQNSYEAQVEYYTSYIKGREDWEFVKVCTDKDRKSVV